MKRKHKPGPAQGSTVADLAERGRRFMANGEWREAIENFKQLVKLDPGGNWEPSLAAAYPKRAMELAEKKMFKEALVLLDNGDRLGPQPHTALLRLDFLIALDRSQVAIELYMREESRLREAYPGLFPVLQDYVAVASLANAVALPEGSVWGAQCQTARQALSAFCSSDHTAMETLLGRISLRSPFRPLRLILKSMLLVHDQPDKARQMVESIPESSPWSRMVRIVSLSLMEKKEWFQSAERFTTRELEVAVGWRGVAIATWRKARELFSASPVRLLPALLDLNPSLGIPDALVRRPAFLLLIMVPGALPAFERRFGPLDTLEKSRLSLLAKEKDRPGARIRALNVYLNGLMASPVSAERDLRIASTCRHTASLLISSDPGSHAAFEALEKSLEYDLNHQKTHLKLIEFYKQTGDEKKLRFVLDRALKCFPDDAPLLHEAVKQALAQKTYKKASRLAKRLLAVDPLHIGVRRDLMGSCLAQARKQVRSGRLDLAEKELLEAASWERTEDRNGMVLINQACLAWLSGRESEGTALLAKGILEAGNGPEACLRAVLEGSRLGLTAPYQTRLLTALTGSLEKQPVSEQRLLALVRVAGEYGGEKTLTQTMAKISKYLTAGAKVFSSSEEMSVVCRILAKIGVYDLLSRYASQGEKKWPGQPIYPYFKLLAKYKGPAAAISYQDFDRLAGLWEVAGDRGDREMQAVLDDWLERAYGSQGRRRDLGSFPGGGDDFPSIFPSFDDDLDDSDGFDFLENIDEERVLFATVLMAAKFIMLERGGRMSREELKRELSDFLEEAASRKKIKVIKNKEKFLGDILREVFSEGGGNPFGEKKPGDVPGKRGASRSRGKRGGGKQQLSFDLDEP